MGTCIICGTSTDGAVCSTHEEDVAFVFEGDSPDQLTRNRYYRGVVDGFAEFGVFVDIGDSVTGLLHRSELDQRLESLDWDAGDEVFVQVTNVRDNGNVDLSWSIRQSPNEFRGTLVDSPNGDRLYDDDDADAASDEDDGADADTATTAGDDADPETTADDDAEATATSGGADDGPTASTGGETHRHSGGAGAVAASADAPSDDADSSADDDSATDDAETPIERESIETLTDRVGDTVRIEGEVTGVRQTSGPTIFELRDETGTIECAAFDGAGIRAFPDVGVGDHVRLDGDVEHHHDGVQVETETLLVLAGDERAAVAERIDAAIEDAVRPDSVVHLAEDDPAAGLDDEIIEAATAIRRAVKEARPVVVRHAATADGHAAGAAIERAVLPLLREEHARSDAAYHYFDRRPLDDDIYGMDAVTGDVTDMLDTRERHGEQLPLIVLAGLGRSEAARDAFELLDVYGVDRVVIDDAVPDGDLGPVTDAAVTPPSEDAATADLTTTALASTVAATVEPDVADDLRHLPAASYWERPHDAYVEIAADAGYDEESLRRIREALALEAHYQSYNDKRELIEDLLFGDADDLAGHVSGQFEEKLDAELSTARANLSRRDAAGLSFAVLDTDAFTHRYDFPPTTLLLDALHRAERSEVDGPLVTVGVGSDELHLRSTEQVDVRTIADRAAEDVPSLVSVGGRDGRIEFLSGVRDEALEAVIATLADELGA